MEYAMDNAVDILLKRFGRVYLGDIFLHIRVLKKLFVRKYERFFLFLSFDWKLEKEKKKEGQLRGDQEMLLHAVKMNRHKNLMLRP